MKIEYEVSPDGLRIEAFPKDMLEIKDTLDYFNRLKNDKKIKHGATEIVYFNHVTDFNISYLESQEITENYQEPKAVQMISKTVFVCKTDLAYGMGRMLQALHKITNPDHNVEVVISDSELENTIKF